jgi:glycosyltransferase involved in cell wall biosynthesis
MPEPRVALVHDFLSQRGGAERVVLELAKAWPGAPLYTSIYDPEATFEGFKSIDVRTTAMQTTTDPARFRRAVLRYPRAFRALDLSAYDLIVVSSSAFAHHVQHPRTLVYCHTPPRYLWSPDTYVGGAAGRVIEPLLAPLRAADRRAAHHVAAYAVNSRATADQVAKVYGRHSTIIHPPLATAHLTPSLSLPHGRKRALVVSRLLPYKRVDLAIRACARAGVPLTVVGDGPMMAELQRSAPDSTTFLGRVTDAELSRLYVDHHLVLVPGAEDFGYVPLEAAWSGRPVVARAARGPLETVVRGVSGFLVDSTDEAQWADAVLDALGRAWDLQALRSCAVPYLSQAFHAAVQSWIGHEVAVPVAA